MLEKLRFYIRYHKYPMVLFIVMSIISPFSWFQGHAIGWGDTGLFAFFYNPNYLNIVYSYTWNDQILTGISSGENISLLPIVTFFNILNRFWLSDYAQQYIIFFFIFFLSMSSTYLFVNNIFYYTADRKLLATICAIFYAFNSLVMINYWYQGKLDIYLLPFISISLYVFSLAIKSFDIIYVIMIPIVFSFFSIVFLNPAFLIPIIMILFLFIVWNIILNFKNKNTVKRIVIYFTIIGILSLLINLWFIIPIILTTKEYYSYATQVMNPLETLKYTSNITNIDSLFRSLPWRLDSDMWAYKDPDWRWLYKDNYFLYMGFIIMFIIFISLMKKDKNILFFSFMMVIGIFLSLGLNSPFGYIFEWMFKNIPYFNIFRSPYNKFIPFLLISYTVLFGNGVVFIYSHMKKKSSHIANATLIIILIIILMYVFPMWTGEVVNTPITIRGNEISSFVDVPSYYNNISNFFANDHAEFRILSLPIRPSTFVGFDWNYGYDGPDATNLLYEHSTISNLKDSYYPSTKILSKIGNHDIDVLYKIIKLFGIKYIVVQNDVDIIHGNYNGVKLINQKDIKSSLSRLNISFIQQFEKLDLYSINDSDYFPKIYTAKSSQTIIQSDNATSVFDYDQNIVISSQNQEKIIPKIEGPKISFQKINPTKYKIRIDKVHEPFWIIFSETYNPYWKIYVNNDSISCDPIVIYADNVTGCNRKDKFFDITDLTYFFMQPLPEKNHFMVNGYANAWYIDPNELRTEKDLTKNFTMTINFKPQSYFYGALIISILTFIVCLTYIVYNRNKNIVYNRNKRIYE